MDEGVFPEGLLTIKKISFTFRAKKSCFRGCSFPAQTPAGFFFNEVWIDMEMGPFAHFAGLLILDSVAGAAGPRMGTLWGMGHMGGSSALFSNADLAGNFVLPGHSNPVSWRAPGNSGPWRVFSFQIGTTSYRGGSAART